MSENVSKTQKIFTVYLVDNYDSFTYNLYQYIGEVLSTAKLNGQIGDFEVIVARNDQVTVADIEAAQTDRIIISPGPGSPDDESYFGVCAKVITDLGPKIPLLGVCLGMQGIVHCFGGKVVKAHLPMHGKVSPISHDLYRYSRSVRSYALSLLNGRSRNHARLPAAHRSSGGIWLRQL
jgi:anthranilate synthase/aminodeoxychorismate synthase-like glutamine amidotransferase